ncbi:DUF2661 domain-containing protein [Saccharolobus islandicus]|uniref:DUF2661 domain-containing protein n=1 Tax=Saccharolobus islandicus TaxID=43080 RepID=UPI00037D5613|nr:DUF2661 domain-containing protein [Sulfolobus islandicus]
MIVPVHVSYRELEEICYADKEYDEIVIYCNDYDGEIEVSVSDVEFDVQDLEEIVDEYLDDIIDILAKYYRKNLKTYKKLTLLHEKSNHESL